ncbi:MAG: preprotein translocase subunit SecB [Sulfitobacter sp.]|jgi:preprotein translocase subunit SecB
MTDTNTNGAAAATETPAQPRLQVMGQFIKDMSFENIAAQKAVQNAEQPDIQVQVNLDARKRANTENQYEVSIKLKIEAKTKTGGETIFIMELDYAGIFLIENVPEDQMHPFLLIECPRMIFPFVRRIVSDVSRDGGFPPLNLETIDFIALYRQELARRAAAKPVAQA